jgi:RNA polymerase sigma factor for flagellar operon FliA
MDWVPRQKRRRARQIENAVATAEQRLQRAPTEEETAAELKVPIAELRCWTVQVRGMNLERLRPAARDESRNLEAVPDSEERLPSKRVERRELRKLLGEVIGRIPEVERMVLRLYYEEGKTLREIAHLVHVHESRISQLKTQAILRLRSRMERYWPTPRGL